MEKLQQIIEVAVDAHKGQTRRGIFEHVPYVQHLFDVHKRVVHYLGADDGEIGFANAESMQVAAIGHDLVEDTSFEIEDISRMFGGGIAELIGELTRDESIGSTRTDKYEYLLGFKEKTLEAVIIKIADRYSNVMDYMADEKKQAYAAFYALAAYPIFQAYLKFGGENIRILDDIHAMDEIVRSRYPTISLFADYADKAVEAIVTTPGLS